MLIQGKQVFALTDIDRRLFGYYMDDEGNILSTRKKGILTKLKHHHGLISLSCDGDRKSFSVKGLQEAAIRQGHSLKPASTPLAQALGLKPSMDIPAQTTATSPVSPVSPAFQVFPQIIKAAVANKKWIIGSVTAKGLSLSATPKIHMSHDGVVAEMKRLAVTRPGDTFVMLQFTGSVTYQVPKADDGFHWG